MKQTLSIEITHDEFREVIRNSISEVLEPIIAALSKKEISISERYIDKKQAADIASVSTSSIDNWARSGYITRFYFGGAVRFWLPELLEFLQSKKSTKNNSLTQNSKS